MFLKIVADVVLILIFLIVVGVLAIAAATIDTRGKLR